MKTGTRVIRLRDLAEGEIIEIDGDHCWIWFDGNLPNGTVPFKEIVPINVFNSKLYQAMK